MSKIQKIADDLLKFANAKSIFLYGSRARAEFEKESDYEIGIMMEKDKYISRSEIKKRFDFKGVHIFPFCYEDFIAGNLDTPFIKSIFIKEIIETGKTLAGEKIIENLKAPEIKLIDIIQDIKFNLGYALAATHSYRNGDNETASIHFTKSCLFSTRDYIIFKTGQFLTFYSEIVEASKSLDLQEYQDLPEYALQLRKEEVGLNEDNLFRNISYLNQFIENQLLATYNKEKGDIALVK